MNECVNCEYCDLSTNECCLGNGKCYDNGVLLQNNCEDFRLGTWSTFDEDIEPCEVMEWQRRKKQNG